MTKIQNSNNTLLDKIVGLAKRRGFIYPGSEIYGGIGGFYDFGPLGAELKFNIKQAWWKDVVQSRDDVVGISAAIVMNPKAWEASGHVAGFSDWLVECKKCRTRYKVADLNLVKGGGARVTTSVKKHAEFMHLFLVDPIRAIREYPDEAKDSYWKCDVCGEGNDYPTLQKSRKFDLMFKTFVGAAEDAASAAYLRPETAGGIFVNFKNVLDTMRVKIPFGIAQIGKAFRNEINPRDFIFRTREFEQMELEYFVKPGEDKKIFKELVEERVRWYSAIGLKNIRTREQSKEERAHYARATVDIEYEFPFGWQEIEGIANRGDFDLSAHSRASGKDLSYFDDETKEKFVPYVIEPSAGVDRILLAVLCEAYTEETLNPKSPPVPMLRRAGEIRNKSQIQNGEEEKADIRIVLKLHPKLAPYKVAVFPLLANKPQLVKKAREVYSLLTTHYSLLPVAWDERGNIGKRYYSQDEIGTPFCVTVDFESLEEKDVTVRDRDTMKQERVKISELAAYLKAELN